jgi:hypothetical protein
VWQGAINYVQIGPHALSGLGFGMQAYRQQVLALVPAARHALGLSITQMTAKWAQYAGLTSAQRALGTRAAALSVGIGEASKSAPAVIQTAINLNPSDFPTYNEFANLGAYLTGSTQIVDFRTALNTFLNTYARAINPQGRMTDQQQRHAYEVLNTAMSQGQIQTGVMRMLKELNYMQAGLSDAVDNVGNLLVPTGETGQPLPPGIPGGSMEIATHNGNRVFVAPDGRMLEYQPDQPTPQGVR